MCFAPIPSCPGYSANRSGEIRGKRGWVLKTAARGTKGGKRQGYLSVTVMVDGKQSHRTVHTMVLEAYEGPRPPDRPYGCHRNGDTFDNRIENLYWGTKSDNERDAVAHGTHSQAGKTECPAGHTYDEENTKIRRDRRHGWVYRVCIRCEKAKRRERTLRELNLVRTQRGESMVSTSRPESTPPFDLVDCTNELLTVTRDALSGALSTARSKQWKGKPWKIYDSEGVIVRTWDDQ